MSPTPADAPADESASGAAIPAPSLPSPEAVPSAGAASSVGPASSVEPASSAGPVPSLGSLQSLQGLHIQVLDALGVEICAGRLAPGTVLTLQEVEERYEVSRSVARETVRVLESMRLVVSRRRVGVVVLDPREWNLFDPRVIRWRLASPDRGEQVDSLAELRIAVEPEAARLAATRATSAQVAQLVGIAGQMWAASEDEDRARFLALDVQFHALVLAASGNAMFAQLESLVSEILTGWLAHGLGPEHPDPGALTMHADAAAAIQSRDPERSFAVMRDLLVHSAEETVGHAGGEPVR